MSTSRAPVIKEIINFNQYPGESLMDAWYRMQEIVGRSPNKYSQIFILKSFYIGLDVWEKKLDTLTYGRFIT